MDQLPPEIIGMICSRLATQDLANFRCCSSKFATTGAYYMIPEVSFHLCDGEIARLDKIARHPIFGEQVRALHYNSSLLSSRLRSYQDFHFQAKTVKVILAELPNSQPLNKPHTDAEFQRYYEVYKQSLSFQTQILSTQSEPALMGRLMKSFPRLEEITMSVGYWFNSKLKPVDPFQKLCLQYAKPRPHSLSEPEGVRELLSIVSAVEESGTQLKSLRAGKINWQFFEAFNAIQRKTPQKFCGVLKHLSTLELLIGTTSPLVYRYGLYGRDLDALHCQRGLKTNVMHQFLMKTPNLRVLHITFDSLGQRNPASLSTIFPVDQTWPHLEKFTLGQVKCTHKELLAVLVKHKPTLKYLSLRDMVLESSWLPFLQQVQQNLNLEGADICGRFGADTEDPENEEYWDIPYPEFNARSHIRIELTRFLVSGGDCPLNRAVMSGR